MITRLCVSTADLAAHLADGWHVVFYLPQPMRGTEWLIERGTI